MNKWFFNSWLNLAVLLIATSVANAQQATEQYIPIGESPGVSGEDSFIGTITDIDYADHKMQIAGTEGQITIVPAVSTRYFLDRTKQKETNQIATFRDCEIGLKVEIKTKTDGSVDWIKIESG